MVLEVVVVVVAVEAVVADLVVEVVVVVADLVVEVEVVEVPAPGVLESFPNDSFATTKVNR